MNAKERAIKMNCIASHQIVLYRFVSYRCNKNNVEMSNFAKLVLEAPSMEFVKMIIARFRWFFFCHWWTNLTAHPSESCNFQLKSAYFDHPIYTRHINWNWARAVTEAFGQRKNQNKTKTTTCFTIYFSSRHIKCELKQNCTMSDGFRWATVTVHISNEVCM